MPGICIAFNNQSSENMEKELLLTSFLELKDKYKDETINISQVSLKSLNYKSFLCNDIVVFIEGSVYNFEEIKQISNSNVSTFSELICEAYNKQILNDILNKINGYFAGCLYDKRKKKLLIFSDRFGLKFMYYYFKNGLFAAASDIKALLPLDIDRTIDDTAINQFIYSSIGFLSGNITYFKHIKLLRPSSVLEYDIENKTIKETYYWKYSEIKKQDISYEKAVDIAHELFMHSMERRLSNIDDKDIQLSLSGGLDSRLCLAAMQEMGKTPAHIWTMGAKNCRDVKISEKVCKSINAKQNLFEINADNWLDNREEAIWYTDGLATLFDLHGAENKKNFTKFNCSYLVDGYCGDAVFGESFKEKPEYLDKRINEEIAKIHYNNFWHSADIYNDYYNIEHIEANLYANRVRRYTTIGLIYLSNFMEPVMPFMDNDIIDFIFSVSDKYRANNSLYSDMLLKYYPRLFKDIPWACTSKPVSGKIYENKSYIDKINFLNKKWKNSISKRLNYYRYLNSRFADYSKLIKTKCFKSLVQKNLKNSPLYVKYLGKDIYKECIDNFNLALTNNLITVELYLRQLRLKQYI